MKSLKNEIISLPILALPYFSGHKTVKKDASNLRVGYVLLRKQPDNPTEPTEYCSRSLTDAGKRYDTFHCKYHAILWAVFLLRTYKEGHRFTIHTDLETLKQNLNLAHFKSRLAQGRLRFSKFDFEDVHRAGI